MHVLRSPLLPHPWSRAPRPPAAARFCRARLAAFAGRYRDSRPACPRRVRRPLLLRPPPSGSRALRPPAAIAAPSPAPVRLARAASPIAAAVAVPLARAAYLGRTCIARPTGPRRVLRPPLPRPSLSRARRTPAIAAAPVPLARHFRQK